MIRTKGNAGTGNVAEAVNNVHKLNKEIGLLRGRDEGLIKCLGDIKLDPKVLEYVETEQRLPLVTFAAGGIATPADASLMMGLGVDGIFVGSVILSTHFRAYSRVQTQREWHPRS